MEKRHNTRNYEENFYHWLWQTLRFKVQKLETIQGQKLILYNTGTINLTDGPDFRNAHFLLDGVEWHGDVEIDIGDRSWYIHNHHTNSRFNSVILHIVISKNKPGVSMRADGTPLFVVWFDRYLYSDIHLMMQQFHTKMYMPCNSLKNVLNDVNFELQLETATHQYFIQKQEAFQNLYDNNKTLSQNWKDMLIVAIFDAHGISHNREPMKQLIRDVMNSKYPKEWESLCKYVLDKAQLNSSSSPYMWVKKQVLPKAYPSFRIPQATAWLYVIHNYTFKKVLDKQPKDIWGEWVKTLPVKHKMGRQRLNTIYCTVFLPSIAVLSTWLHEKKLKKWAYESWQKEKINLPQTYLKMLSQTPLNIKPSSASPALVYQLREYCIKKRCYQCKVMQNGIKTYQN